MRGPPPDRTLAATPDLDGVRVALAAFVRAAQDELCAALERADGAGRFSANPWERKGGGERRPARGPR